MKRLASLLLALAATALTSCTTIPAGLQLAPRQDAVARKVARLLGKAGCRMGFAAIHVQSGRRLAWNAGEAFEGASAIKIALLAEAAARIHEGTLDPTDRWKLTPAEYAAGSGMLDEFEPGLEPTNRDLLRLMIGISDNTAADSFIDRFGAEAVNHRMQTLGLPGIQLLGRIPSRDPKDTEDSRWRGLKLSSMTPADTAELYRRVVSGTLISPDSDRFIWEILKAQHYRERLPRLLLSRPGYSWAGKTGTMRGVRADSGILTTPKGSFVLVAFADQIPDGPQAVARAKETMGEIAAAIVDGWSPSLPDVPPPPPYKPERTPAPALERVEMTPLEEGVQTPYVERVFRDTDRRFWELWKKAGGHRADSCLIPSPNSWWEGDSPAKIEPISAIILHHTSEPDDESCIALFQKPESFVSAHFLVGRDGRLYQFVSLEHRAWHAGVSVLNGRRALNKTSIGIEISGDGNVEPFTRAQVETVVRLVGVLTALFDIKAPWISGHQQIAPDRKVDPGELFPWNEVVSRALALAARLSPGTSP